MKSYSNYAFILLGLLLLLSCKEEEQKDQISSEEQIFAGTAIGTTYTVKFFHDEQLALTKDVDSIIKMFNNSMSTWIPSSLINKFNNGEDSVLVGKPFKEVFDQAIEIHKNTKGYLDPTVGNLVNAYGFGAAGQKSTIPSESKLDSLKNFIGLDKVKLLQSTKKDSFFLTSSTEGIYIEFNAIGKGTLVDHIGRLLENKGVSDYLVEVGGEVVARGKNLNRDGSWAVGIDDPNQTPDERRYITVVNLDDRAMAGSGNYRKNKVDSETGMTYVHTVNPITGKAQPSQVLGVNVMAKNCTLADGYATAFMAMPLEMSIKLMHEIDGIDVLIMHMDKNGMLRLETTEGFKNSIKQSSL